MSERRSQCVCGSLSVTVLGEPELVALCNCGQCQRRTGSVFSQHAFFPRDNAVIHGEHKAFTRSSDSGRKVTFHFCPTCASTIFWEVEARPNSWGMAVGGFEDPHFPPPERAVWGEKKHDWVRLPDGIPVLPRGRHQAAAQQ